MSIQITLRQKGLLPFWKKTLPFEVILGDQLHYGVYDKLCLKLGKRGDGPFTAYLPNAIGRGIEVEWSETEKQQVTLSLETPCHDAELKELFAMAERIMRYWKCKLFFGGEKKPVKNISMEMLYANSSRYNREHLYQMIEQVMEEEVPIADLGCACWPLSMGRREAEYFLEHPTHFSHWLHRAQVMDAYYSYPDFWVKQDGTVEGQYLLVQEAENLLPYDPSAGHWETNKKTGEPMTADEYRIIFFISPNRDEVVDLPYSVFIRSMDATKAKSYDKRRFWMAPLSYEELAEIYQKGCEILAQQK